MKNMKNISKSELVQTINDKSGAAIASARMTREQLENLLAVIDKASKASASASKASKASKANNKPTHTPKAAQTQDAQPKRKMRRITSKRDFNALLKALEQMGIESKKIEVQASTLWVNQPNKAQRESLKRLGFIGNRRPRRNGKPNGVFCKVAKDKTYDLRKWYKPTQAA